MPISADIFAAIGVFIGQSPEMAAKIKTVFQFKLSDPSAVWTVDLAAGNTVSSGQSAPPQCTLELSDSDFMAMCTGSADAMKLFTSGKLKIAGDIMASQKLDFLSKLPPALVLEQAQKRGGGGDGQAAAQSAEEPTSWDVFVAIRDHVQRHPELVDKVGFVFGFNLTAPSSSWTVDVKNTPGSVSEGSVGTIDCTLEISETDFIAMTKGQADPMKLFTTGKLKISGNIMASQKLDFLQKMDKEQAIAAVRAAREAGQGPGKSSASPSAASGPPPCAPAVFAALTERLAERPGLADEVGVAIEFRIGEQDGADCWLVNLGEGGPSVDKLTKEASRQSGDSAAVIAIADDDLRALVSQQSSAARVVSEGQVVGRWRHHRGSPIGFLEGSYLGPSGSGLGELLCDEWM